MRRRYIRNSIRPASRRTTGSQACGVSSPQKDPKPRRCSPRRSKARNPSCGAAESQLLGNSSAPHAPEPGAPEKKVARASLVRLRGSDIDAALIQSIDTGEPKVAVEVITAL